MDKSAEQQWLKEYRNSANEHHNASQFPKEYYCRHMQPGVCGYQDENVLVDTDAIKRMLGNDAVGKPVYILHNESSNEDRLAKIKEESAGYITGSFYNELDGWGWFKLLVIDDSAHAAIQRGWKVSNAYLPTEWGSGGTKNNVRYHREVLNGQFTHLAIVPDPRYEDACIMTPEQFRAYQESKKRELAELHNAKSESSKGTTMFKLFKNQRTETSAVEADTLVELENGKTYTIGEMINAVKKNSEDDEAKMKAEKEAEEKKNAEEAAKKKAEEMENAMVDCGGEKMTVKELANRFSVLKNAKEEEEKKKADEEKKNAEEEEKRKKEEEEKKNSHFNSLYQAPFKAADSAPEPVHVETAMDKVARGKQAYGSKAV